MVWIDTTMLLKFFGMSEPSAAARCRSSCQAMRDGELLRRFESMEAHEDASLGVNLPSVPWLMATTSNASIPRQTLQRRAFVSHQASSTCEQ